MKKSAISLSLLLLMGATALTSCNNAEIKPLKIGGKDVLFSIGETKFTANDLLGSEGDFTFSFLKSEEGARELYKAIEKAIVEKSVDLDDNIKNAVEIKMDDWAKKVESYADENGLTDRIAEKALLEQEGFDTRKDLEASYVFQEKKTQFIKNYKDERIQPNITSSQEIDSKDDSLLREYVTNTNPMIMKHVLVKTADSASAFAQANITEAEADKLGTVVMRLALGNKDVNSFAQVAIDESEDGSSKNGGNLGIVDEYTSFVNEFKFGVYSSIAYEAKGDTTKFNKIVDELNLDKTMFEADGIYETMDSIEVIDAITALVDNAHVEHKPADTSKDPDYRLHDRNIEFNKEFNFTGAKYLKVSDKAALASKLGCEQSDIRVNSDGFVIDENEKPIVVTRSEYGIHFISVTWSSLDLKLDDKLNEAIGYFVTDPLYKDIEKGYYKNEEFNKGNTETKSTQEKNRKNEIEGRVINYVQGGYASSVSADEQIMIYKMVKENLKEVEIHNEDVKKIIESYIDLKINAVDKKIENEVEKSVESYVNKVEASVSAHEMVDQWLENKGGKVGE